MTHPFKHLLLSGTIFGLLMAGAFLIFLGPLSFFVGVFCALLFILLSSPLVYFQTKKLETFKNELQNHQKVMLDGSASHIRGLSLGFGWLFLTKRELIFKTYAHSLDGGLWSLFFKKPRPSILLRDIKEIRPFDRFEIICQGFEIHTHDGQIDRFIVDNKQDWMERLNQSLKTQYKYFDRSEA